MAQAAAAAAPEQKQSRLGKRPVDVPKGVKVTISGSKVDVQGPKGKLSRVFPDRIAIAQEGDVCNVTSSAPGTDGPRLQGLGRALLASMVKGCAEGYVRILDLVGTGYRADLKGKRLHFALGLSHPVDVELPEGVTCEIPKESKGAAIILTSANKEVVGQLAATIRGFRPPEPYGGKGVRYRGEQIVRKAGKAGKGRK
jgi:large subunit ribosomal protein L6